MNKPQIPFSWIGLTEDGVFNPPRDMEGWRLYRIEYGGFHEHCRVEGRIWLPNHADPDMIEVMLRGMIVTENTTLYGDEMAREDME